MVIRTKCGEREATLNKHFILTHRIHRQNFETAIAGVRMTKKYKTILCVHNIFPDNLIYVKESYNLCSNKGDCFNVSDKCFQTERRV